MDKPHYWPGTTTLVTEVDPVSYQGRLPEKRTYGRGTGADNLNVTTRSARKYLDECFRLCGGIEAFTRWAKKNPSDFYPLYIKARVPRPLPTVEDEDGDTGITIIVQASTNTQPKIDGRSEPEAAGPG